MINLFRHSGVVRHTPYFLRHNENCMNRVGRNLAPIFKRASTSFILQMPPQRNRCWLYLCAALFTGVSLEQASAFSNEKAADEEEGILEKSIEPIASISSGTYRASCYNPIPAHIARKMIGKSYKENCPTPMTDLAYLQITHYDMSGKICLGELVVHKRIAARVMEIFREIHAAQFPIEKMRLIDEYEADDERSMEDNNSSAFCFRSITGRPGVVSNHGLGIAIDINTRLNPYVMGDHVAPSNARRYVDRSLTEPGMIQPEDAVVRAFKERGFTWGGDWRTRKDYQHFEIDRIKVGIA